MKYKPGDKVYSNYGDWYEIISITSEGTYRVNKILTINGFTNTSVTSFRIHPTIMEKFERETIGEEIYNSPLYQVMKED